MSALNYKFFLHIFLSPFIFIVLFFAAPRALRGESHAVDDIMDLLESPSLSHERAPRHAVANRNASAISGDEQQSQSEVRPWCLSVF